MIKVNSSKCPANHKCPLVIVCPVRAITQKEFNAPEVDTRKCIECLKCVNKCAYQVFEKI
ncbi:MAG: 4Fe-4S ferredoxin [archaeon]